MARFSVRIQKLCHLFGLMVIRSGDISAGSEVIFHTAPPDPEFIHTSCSL